MSATAEVSFTISGVTAGKYWVKAVFDASAPIHDTPEMYAGEAGDFESNGRKVIEVRAGETVGVGWVPCTTPVGK